MTASTLLASGVGTTLGLSQAIKVAMFGCDSHRKEQHRHHPLYKRY
jgi:hypothetical protein